MKVGLICAVNSSLVTLEALIKHQFEIALVMGYVPRDSNSVIGYIDLSLLSRKHDLPYRVFHKIN